MRNERKGRKNTPKIVDGECSAQSKKPVGKILASVFMLFLSAALVAGGALLAMQKTPFGEEGRLPSASSLAATYESFDENLELKNGSHDSDWNAVVASSNAGKKLYVTLKDNWNPLPNMLTVPAGHNITLDLNGKTISRNLSSAVVRGGIFDVFGTLTIVDTSAAGTGTLTGGYSKGSYSACIHIESNGKFIMNGGKITQCRVIDDSGVGSSASVQIATGAEFIMNGGEISHCTNTADVAGGVRVSGGTFTMNGGKITENESLYGGGVSVGTVTTPGTFTMNGGEISKNDVATTLSWGGGILFHGGTITMNGGTISGNTSSGNGGGVYFAGSLAATFTMNGGSITGNRSGQSKNGTTSSAVGYKTGGGLYVSGANSKFIMNGGEITNNTAAGTGVWAGGLIVNSNAKAYFLGGTISGNTTDTEGGGVYLASCTAYFGGVTITGNTTKGTGSQGGGVKTENPNNMHLVGGTVITGNKSNGIADNLYLGNATSNKLLCHQAAGTVDGVSYPGFYNDFRIPQIRVGFGYAIPSGGGLTFTSGLTGAAIWPGRIFTPDNTAYVPSHDYTTSAPNHLMEARFYNLPGYTFVTLNWEVQLDGAATWYQITDSALQTMLGATVNEDKSTLTYTYDSGHYVSAVKASYDGNTLLDTTAGNCHVYRDSFGGRSSNTAPPFPTAKNAGHYSFLANTESFTTPMYSTYNSSLDITVKRKDVKINIKDQTIEYGFSKEEFENELTKQNTSSQKGYWEVDPSTPLASGDSLNVKLAKSAGTQAGYTYLLTPAPEMASSISNPNYNITFANTGKLKIVPRKVTILLNDDYKTYGDDNLTATGVQNSANYAINKENTSGDYKDAAGTAVPGKSKGGWQYGAGTDIDGKPFAAGADLHKIVANDLNSGAAPFTYTFADTTGKYNSNDSEKYLNVGSYIIAVDCNNPNYEITFYSANNYSADSPGDPSAEYTFEVRKASLTGLKTSGANGVPNYTSATYSGSAHNVALPDAALNGVKGYLGILNTTGEHSTATYYQYAVYSADSAPSDGASVSGWGQNKQITTEGTYKIFVKITLPNHNEAIYSYTFTFSASGINYKVEITKDDDSSVVSAENPAVYGEDITANVKWEWEYDTLVSKPDGWDTDFGNITIEFYYVGIGNSYGTDDADESEGSGLGSKTMPTDVGEYAVSVRFTGDAAENYKFTAADTYTFEINAKKITVPTPSPTTAPSYDGTAKNFTVTLPALLNGDTVAVGSLSGSTFSETLPNGVTSSAANTYSATNAGKYTLALRLPANSYSTSGSYKSNYVWDPLSSNGAVATVTFEIKQKELDIKWYYDGAPVPVPGTSLTVKYGTDDGDITAEFNTKQPATVEGVQEEPVLIYTYQGSEGGPVEVETLNVSALSVGDYTVTVKLKDGEAVNKNYTLPTPPTLTVKVKAGDADLSDVVFYVTREDDETYDKDHFDDIVYAKSNGAALYYEGHLNTDSVDFLEEVGSATYKKGNAACAASDVTNAGTYSVTFTVKIKDSVTDKTLPDTFTSDEFTYVKNADGTATLTYEFTIHKAYVDVSELKLQYQIGSTWYDYDPANPPEYTGFQIRDVQWKPGDENLPEGVTAVSCSLTGTNSNVTNGAKGPGTVEYQIHFTLDPNYQIQADDQDQKGTITITKKAIDASTWKKVAAKDENGDPILDADGKPIMIDVLDVEDVYADSIEYTYEYNGQPYNSLKELVEAEQPSATHSIYITVKAKVVDDQSDLYGLKEDGQVKDEVTKSNVMLGDRRDPVTVTVKKQSMVYGGTVAPSDLYSVNTDPDCYTVKLIDKDGNEKSIENVDFATLPAGEYTVQFAFTEGWEEALIFTPFDSFTFTVEKQEIVAPVVSDMPTFTGEYINIIDLLGINGYITGGIIKYTGTDGEQQCNAGDYTAKFTIDNPNYAWAPGEGVNGDELTLSWKINRAVLSVNWNKNNKNAWPDLPNALSDWKDKPVDVKIGYRYYDNNHTLLFDTLLSEEDVLKPEAGVLYYVTAYIAGEDADNFEFEGGETVTGYEEYTAPRNGASEFFRQVGEFLANYWQQIVSGVCILLSIIFIILIAHYDSQRRKANKQKKQYTTYATVAPVLLLAALWFDEMIWTIIACSLIGLAFALFIGVFIAKARRNKAREALAEAKQDYEEHKDERAEEKRRKEEEERRKEEEKRREEERLQREEERRQREEERQEEKRRREEEREEERRRREEDREEERRRREEERERIAAMGAQPTAQPVVGAPQPAAQPIVVTPAAAVPATPAVSTSQPIVFTTTTGSATPIISATPVTPVVDVVVERPVAAEKTAAAQPNPDSVERAELDQKLNQLRNEFKDDQGHQERVEQFLAMIANSREQDRAKLREEEREREERKRNQEARRAGWMEPNEPTFVTKSGEEYYQRMGYGMRPVEHDRLREMEIERAVREKEFALREKEAVLRERERELERDLRERDRYERYRYYYPQTPMIPPVLSQPMVMQPPYVPPYAQPPVQPAQPSNREIELERELREKEHLLLEKESERARNLERELALERERNRNLMQSVKAPVDAPQTKSSGQPVVVVPPIIQQAPNARRSNVFSADNPFSVNYRASNNGDDE